jgi:hypothetical protein
MLKHYLSFIEKYLDIFIIEQVITTSRRYQSAAGRQVPNFLPDFQSNWFKYNNKLGGKIESNVVFNNDSFRDDIEEFRNAEGTHLSDLRSEEEHGSMDLLGMLVYKIDNNDELVPNVMHSNPVDPIVVADFDPTLKGQIPYKYANNVLGNLKRSEDDREDIREWLKTMPPRPIDKSSGFKSGAAASWFKFLHGESYELVLPRVLAKLKNPALKRPPKSAYAETHTLETDQAILDSLPKQCFFTAIGNSNNAGKEASYHS